MLFSTSGTRERGQRGVQEPGERGPTFATLGCPLPRLLCAQQHGLSLRILLSLPGGKVGRGHGRGMVGNVVRVNELAREVGERTERNLSEQYQRSSPVHTRSALSSLRRQDPREESPTSRTEKRQQREWTRSGEYEWTGTYHGVLDGLVCDGGELAFKLAVVEDVLLETSECLPELHDGVPGGGGTAERRWQQFSRRPVVHRVVL